MNVRHKQSRFNTASNDRCDVSAVAAAAAEVVGEEGEVGSGVVCCVMVCCVWCATSSMRWWRLWWWCAMVAVYIARHDCDSTASTSADVTLLSALSDWHKSSS